MSVELTPKSLQGFPCDPVATKYSRSILVGQFGQSVSFAVGHSSFFDGIFVVVITGPEKHVVGITAGRVVATGAVMKDA